MKKHSIWRLAAIAAILLLLPFTSLASVTVSAFQSGMEDTVIIMEDGKALLAAIGPGSDINTLASRLNELHVDEIGLLAIEGITKEQAAALALYAAKWTVRAVWFAQPEQGDQSYQDLYQAFLSKGVQPSAPKAGLALDLGSAKVTVAAVIGADFAYRLEYGSYRFLFSGSADLNSLATVQSNGASLSADVLLSAGTLSPAALDAVSPIFALDASTAADAALPSGGTAVLHSLGQGSETFVIDGTKLAVTGAQAYGVTAKNGINVRKSATTNSKKIASLSNNTVVLITGAVKTQGGETWFYVDLGGKTGYIRSDLITLVTYEQMSALPKATPKVDTVSGSTKKGK
jgi:hypothetical protein